MKTKLFLALAAMAASTVASQAQLKVTEIMYTGLFGEFIEVTNTGSALTNISNFSFDDSSAVPGTVPFPAVALANGQTVIITEVSATIFNQAWYTEPTTDPVIANAPVIIANNDQNLGRADTVYIFNSSSIQDQVTYNDQASPQNGPRSEDVSIVPFSGWDYLLPNATNVVSGTTRHDWVLSNGKVSVGGADAVSVKWKAGVGGNGPGGNPIPGPIGSPGVASYSSVRGLLP